MRRVAPSLTIRLIATLLATAATTVQINAAENTRTRDVVYGREHGIALTMDVWQPANRNGAGAIFFVSGAFKSGIDMINSGFYGPVGFKPFLDRGYTVFLVCHGSQPKYIVEEIINQAHRAVRFIKHRAADYDVDQNRIAVMGISSSGYLSLMIGASGGPGPQTSIDPRDRVSSRVTAVGCFCPPSDLVNYGKPDRTFLEYQPVHYVWQAVGLDGKPKDEQIKVLTRLSPLSALHNDMPPTLIIHGDQDPLVPIEQSKRFAAKLTELKVPHELVIRKGAKHGWPTMGEDHALLADWFDKHMPATNQAAK